MYQETKIITMSKVFKNDREGEGWLSDHRKFDGDSRLKEKLVFRRGSKMRCIYCGGTADTREHCPSKMLVSDLGDINLPVLPACFSCNNGFSEDELFAKSYLDYIKIWQFGHALPENVDLKTNIEKEALSQSKRFIETNGSDQNERVKRILIKLAIGHATYELSEDLSFGSGWTVSAVQYLTKSMVDKEDWNLLQKPVEVSEESFPEIGSRQYTDIMIVEGYRSVPNVQNHIFLIWQDIKEGVYSYIAYSTGFKEIVVKIVIGDVFFAQISFERN